MIRKLSLAALFLTLTAAAQEPKKESPKRVTINAELLQAVVNYLGTQPYQNVAQLIQAIQQDAKSEVECKTEKK